MSSLRSKKVILTVITLLAFGGLFTGIFVSQHLHFKKKIDVTRLHGTYLNTPRTVNSFVLTGIDQKPFNNSSLHGQWTLVFFGFTSCGYLCPTTMAELGKMYRILQKSRVERLPRIVMISIDPERDNLIKLSHYVSTFHPDFYGATGEEDSIKLMTREMGIANAKVNTKSRYYDIQHSGALMLFNPNGELNAFFTTPHHADLLAKDYMLIVSSR